MPGAAGIGVGGGVGGTGGAGGAGGSATAAAGGAGGAGTAGVASGNVDIDNIGVIDAAGNAVRVEAVGLITVTNSGDIRGGMVAAA